MMYSFIQSVISFLFPPECFLCKKNEAILCDGCLRSIKPSIETPHHSISAYYSYKDPKIKKIIHAIKFFHRKDLLLPLSQKISRLLPDERSEVILVPIPMPRIRELLRGYNQSELLAREISILSEIPIDTSLLKRKKAPSRQVRTTTKGERFRNQKNTLYTVRILAGEHIILIDDVTTTGATLLEARKILLASGAGSVMAITIAH